jgi:hypothetical protein
LIYMLFSDDIQSKNLLWEIRSEITLRKSLSLLIPTYKNI